MDQLNARPQHMPNLFNTPMVGTKKEAILYLFSQHPIVDHYKRPLIYNFNAPFVEEMHKVISEGLMPNTNYPIGSGINLNKLYHNPYSAGIIMPAATGGIPVNTSLFSDAWTFMFVVTNEDPAFRQTFAPASSNRTIYYGYCTEEPINRFTMNVSGGTINEGCFLTITHKTVIKNLLTATPMGNVSKLDTVADVDVIPGRELMALSNNKPLIMNRPGDIHRMTIDNTDHTTSVGITSMDILGNTKEHIASSSYLNIPRHSCKKIIDSIIVGCETAADDQLKGCLGEYASIGDSLDNIKSVIGSHLEDQTNENAFGLQISGPISMGEICGRYHPKVVPVIIEKHLPGDIIPQHYQSKTNIYSSMIASAAPAILSNIGLASIALMYNSPTGFVNIMGSEPFIPIPLEQLHIRTRAAVNTIKAELFDIIRATAGEFDVNMSISCGGDSRINLNMLDSDETNYGVYQNHNLLGGITNQVVGDFNIIENNIMSLGNVVNGLTSAL